MLGAIGSVRFLLDTGMDATTQNEFGETPSQMAHIVDELEVEELLLHIAGNIGSGHDGGFTARQRWLEFESMQRKNFGLISNMD